MKFPVICFDESELRKMEEKICKSPYQAVFITIKELKDEGIKIIENVKYLDDSSPKYKCYPVLPEDCSSCSKAETMSCSRWWAGEWANDRPEIDKDDLYDLYPADQASQMEMEEEIENHDPEDNDSKNNNNEFSDSHYLKIWSKKYPVMRTIAMLATLRGDEHLFRTALLLAQFRIDDLDWAEKLYQSDLPWDTNFLPHVVEIPMNRREVKIFKKIINKIIKDTKEIDPMVREIWLAFIAGHVAEKWGLNQEILSNWLSKIFQKL